jgi:hypothetical protein
MAGRVNWPQAFAEVGLLSLGVVVALAGQAWMEERNERVEEREYLVALQRDFEETLVESQEYIHINESRLASVIALMEVTAPSELAGVPSDGLDTLLLESFGFWEYNPTLETYQDMVNSGDLRLLRSDELRVALVGFSELVLTIGTIDGLQLTQYDNFEMPFFRDHLALGRVFQDYRGVAEHFGVTVSGLQLPERGFGHDMEALGSREFHNILAGRAIIHQDAIVNMAGAMMSIDAIARMIEDELGRIRS